MPRAGRAPSPRVARLIEWGDAIGAPSFGLRAGEQWLSQLGEDGARRRLAEYGMIAAAFREHGEEPTLRTIGLCWQRMGQCGVVVAARIRRRAARREVVGRRGGCAVGIVRALDVKQREKVYAECACERCVERLLSQLRAYARKVAIKYRADLSIEDACDEIPSVLLEALISWPGEESFAAWMGGCVKTHFRKRLERVQREPRTVTLDEDRIAA